MKHAIFIFTLLSSVHFSHAQGVKIGSAGDPQPSSVLELESSSQGFLPPRLTTAERDAILNPVNGLMLFNSDTGCFNYRLNGAWSELCGSCTPQPPAAQAGPDQLNVNGTNVTLSANTANPGTGAWTIVSGNGGSFSDSSSPSSDFSGTGGETYQLRWTISTSCGSTQDEVTVSFMIPFSCGPSSVSDASGNTYATVQVGSQCWLKSNLRTLKYNNGTDIPSGYMVQWGVNGAPACSASNFNATSCGILYDGNVMQNSVSPCPVGWHIPTLSEFQALYTSVANDSRRLFHPSAGCVSNCSGYDLYICGQNYVQWEGCGSGDQIYLWTRPNSGNIFTNSYITQYNSGNGTVSYNQSQGSWINYNYSIRCLKD